MQEQVNYDRSNYWSRSVHVNSHVTHSCPSNTSDTVIKSLAGSEALPKSLWNFAEVISSDCRSQLRTLTKVTSKPSLKSPPNAHRSHLQAITEATFKHSKPPLNLHRNHLWTFVKVTSTASPKSPLKLCWGHLRTFAKVISEALLKPLPNSSHLWTLT